MPTDIQPLRLNATPQIGSPVRVIGHPEDEEWKDDTGKVSDVSSDELLLRISLKAGNSGSPVLDSNNQVVGIVKKIGAEQIGFAIPTTRIVQQLKQWGISLPQLNRDERFA